MESDDDIEDLHEEQVKVEEPEEDDEIVESDIELEGEIVEPDDDPPQKVTFFLLQKFVDFCCIGLFFFLMVNEFSDGRPLC